MSDARPSSPSPSPATLDAMWDRPCDMQRAGFIYALGQLGVRIKLEKEDDWDEASMTAIKRLRFHLHMECVSLGVAHLSQAVLESMEGGYNAIREEAERLEARDRQAEAEAKSFQAYGEPGTGITRYTPGPGEPGPTRGGPVVEPGGDYTPRLYPEDDDAEYA